VTPVPVAFVISPTTNHLTTGVSELINQQTDGLLGRVVGVERHTYEIQTASGHRLLCRLRGKLARAAATSTTALVVVGDRVRLGADSGATEGLIEAILPRDTVVSRRAPGPQPKEHILAANLDQAAVVVSLLEPRFKVGTVSQFVTGARAGGAEPLIILNKVDLGDRSRAMAELEPFARAGIRCLSTSARSGEGVDELRAALSGRWTLLYGQSGVGKSSLLNAVRGEGIARVGAISDHTQWGRHTTTGSRVYQLGDGGYVIDTPGMRAFAFWAAPEREQLDDVYPEIAELAHGCRFDDCSHISEPGCAVKDALARGEIDQSRYRHYVRLAQSAKRKRARGR